MGGEAAVLGEGGVVVVVVGVGMGGLVAQLWMWMADMAVLMLGLVFGVWVLGAGALVFFSLGKRWYDVAVVAC